MVDEEQSVEGWNYDTPDDPPLAVYEGEEITPEPETEEEPDRRTVAASFSSACLGREHRRGERNWCVKQIQRALGNYYTGIVHGKFDSATEQAVKNFQSDNGLESTGVVDRETFEQF